MASVRKGRSHRLDFLLHHATICLLTLNHGANIMSLSNQHERVRALSFCVCCKGPKAQGLVICWPCHRREKNANGGGYSVETELRIDRLERSLAAADKYDDERLLAAMRDLVVNTMR
jgi:hypothetical protein